MQNFNTNNTTVNLNWDIDDFGSDWAIPGFYFVADIDLNVEHNEEVVARMQSTDCTYWFGHCGYSYSAPFGNAAPLEMGGNDASFDVDYAYFIGDEEVDEEAFADFLGDEVWDEVCDAASDAVTDAEWEACRQEWSRAAEILVEVRRLYKLNKEIGKKQEELYGLEEELDGLEEKFQQSELARWLFSKETGLEY